MLLSRERTPAAEADLDVAELMARLNVVPFPVWSFAGVFPADTNLASSAYFSLGNSFVERLWRIGGEFFRFAAGDAQSPPFAGADVLG